MLFKFNSEFLVKKSQIPTNAAWFIALCIVLGLLTYEFVRWTARVPDFKGPSGLPIVGNLWDIRNRDAAELYRTWKDKYGAVYQIQLGNIPVLVVNSAAAAKTIFAHNSSATASRPEFYTFHKIIANTSGTTIGTTPFTETLKRRRKAAATALNRNAIQNYVSHLDIETKVFLREAVNYGKWGKEGLVPMPVFLRMNLSLGLTLNWGTRMESQTDQFREIIYVEDQISSFRSTTGNLQDYIPLLRYNPFSGGSAKAADMRARRDVYMKDINQDLDERIEKGIHKPCIQANVRLDEDAILNQEELTSINLTLLAAGLDTMNSAVCWGIAQLANNPEVQEKALKEIRKHYPESDPLCDAKDDQKCTYIVILIKEILRFYSVTRLSLPRCTTQDFVFEKKVIPRGTVMFLNVWACNMDPEVWTDPFKFRPERWLENPDASIFTFGIGSRMCIGSQMAYRELYLLFLRVLSSFKIVPDGHVESHPLDGVVNPTALTTTPKDYKVKFVPRNLDALRKALDI